MLLTFENVVWEWEVSNEDQPNAWKHFSDSEHSERVKLYWQEKYWLLLYVRNERWLEVMPASVISIKEPTEFKDSVENIQIRLLGEVEQWVSDVEDVNARVEDLENWSQRTNVRMVVLKEGEEERRYMAQEVKWIISQELGIMGSEFKVGHTQLLTGP